LKIESEEKYRPPFNELMIVWLIKQQQSQKSRAFSLRTEQKHLSSDL
jgi:hypothetical protein